MKIGHIAPINFNIPRGRGGPTRNAFNLNEALKELGHEIVFYGCKNSEVTADKLKYIYPVELNSDEEFLNADRMIRAQMIMNHYAFAYSDAEDIDIYQSHHLEWALPLSSIKKGGISVIRMANLLNERRLKTIEDFNHDNAHLVMISETQASTLPAHIKNYTVIYNGIDVKNIPFSDSKEDYYLFVGRLIERKGADIAIKACIKSNKKLIIVGKPVSTSEKSREYFAKEIEPYLDSELIEYIPSVNHYDLLSLYKNAKALIFPLRDANLEPFGLVTVEAMATGTPVIAIDNSLMRELVDDRKTGILATNENEIMEIIQVDDFGINPENCRDLVEKKFSKEIMARKYSDLYEKILKISK